MGAPEAIRQLVKTFDSNLESYKNGSYKETTLRQEFINPFFKALEWDMANEKGYAPAYKEVVHEDAIKVGSATKAPDYSFRIGGNRKFFVEAKKPSVDIKDDVHPAYQLRRYAWSAKLPLSILTDFEEFAVYDCQTRPKASDKADTGRIMFLNYRDYIERWDEIANIFSRYAILKGSFDKFITTTKGKRGTSTIDVEILNEIEEWRKLLAKYIARDNRSLSREEINFAVQRTIDRLLFLRMCEDRAIENYGQLQALIGGERIYPRLCELFERADEKYNSGLFHFRPEKDRAETPDELTLNLKIDDMPLRWILGSVYYPKSPYEFSVVSPEVLGNVYEQFLGKVITLSEAHTIKIEEKPEVKKAGGVYYTPEYIVKYIVKNTIGKLCENKTPKEIAKLRILDPACGSGSFLLGAYTYLLDYHRDWYVDNDPAKFTKQIYEGKGGQWLLAIAEKKRILLNNIYGVDIDSQAVEVTKLSLLLKVLESENLETLKLIHERALPDLGNNIKCGNSLIAPDFFDNSAVIASAARQSSSFDSDDLHRHINAFDWQKEFPQVFKQGGFDAVIGNPPYVRQETLGEFKDYFAQHYKVYDGIADLYTYFIEKGINLLRKDGRFSFIVANKWMRANYGKPLREWLKHQHIEQIIDFGDLPVFRTATTYPCIIVISKEKPAKEFSVTQMKTLDFQGLSEYVTHNTSIVFQDSLNGKGWVLTDKRTQRLLEKLHKQGTPIKDYVAAKLFRGIITGLNNAFVITNEERKTLIKKSRRSAELIKPFLLGRDVKAYEPVESDRFLIFMPKGWTLSRAGAVRNAWVWLQKEYQAVAEYLAPFRAAAEKRCDKGDYWWELRACDYYDEFEKQKIIYPNICKRPEFSFDDKGLFTNQKCFIIPVPDKYLLGILNSSVIFFLFRQLLPKLRGNFYEPSYVYFSKFPIRTIDFSKKDDKAKHNKMVSLVERMLELHKKLNAAKVPDEKTKLQRQIDTTDAQIDKLVYDLYDLTPEEIEIVENSAKP